MKKWAGFWFLATVAFCLAFPSSSFENVGGQIESHSLAVEEGGDPMSPKLFLVGYDTPGLVSTKLVADEHGGDPISSKTKL
jgi:hypothetical protein